jgi:hypothetical protein
MADVKWEEVYRTGDDFQMEFIRGLLKSAEIPVMVERKGAKDMPTIMGVASYGDYVLRVPPDQADFARELLAAPPEMPDSTEPEPSK